MKLIPDFSMIDSKKSLYQYTQPLAKSLKAILNQASKLDTKGETIKALMFIEYASHWSYTIDELLQHEITNSAFF